MWSAACIGIAILFGVGVWMTTATDALAGSAAPGATS